MTHIVSNEEKDKLSLEWAALWGAKGSNKILSYWSVHPQKQRGVAILVCPDIADQITPFAPEKWSNRVMLVYWNDCLIINVYGPSSDVKHREVFFGHLRLCFERRPKNCVLGGDFNWC